MIELPEPRLESDVSVEQAIAGRRSRRQFTDRPLTLQQVAQILWSAQGLTGEAGRKRAAPSAGATYPMYVYLAVGAGRVEGLEAGVYRYHPADHALEKTMGRDIRRQVVDAALGQDFLAAAPVDLLLAADYERTRSRYGERTERYVHMEAGHIGQNVYLQAESLGLGTVAVGAFRDASVGEAFGLSGDLQPLYLMPVGHAR
jgi:SagB-type dehydrogenase family enzyme